MDNIVVLEWTFSPPDYFEEVLRVEHEGYTMVIDMGKVEARIDPKTYDKEHDMRDELHKVLNDYFLGVQLLTHKPYELSESSMHRLHPDGRKEITLFVRSVESISLVGSVDLIGLMLVDKTSSSVILEFLLKEAQHAGGRSNDKRLPRFLYLDVRSDR